jgi:hypothetical protein
MVLTIVLKSNKTASWHERLMYSWYDDKKQEIVLLVDRNFVKSHLPDVLSHEVAHHNFWVRWHKHKILYWILGHTIEEPYIWVCFKYWKR